MTETDVVIIGAGHNGLTCAAYLAMAGPAREGGRAPQGGRRRRGDRGIPSGFPQFGRGLHRQPAQPADHFRPETERARPAHRRAPRAEFPARPRRQLSADRRRPHPSIGRKTQRARRRPDRRLQPRTRGDRRRAARNSCCARRRTSSRALAPARSAKPSTRSAPPTSCAGCRWSSSAACSICSRARPARCWTTRSRAIWSRRCSASTPSSAITPAPTPRARPM